MSGTQTITLSIPLAAIGKPRMTQRDTWKKRPCVVDYRAWADSVRLFVHQQVGRAGLPDPETIDSLDWLAEFAPPASWSRRKKEAAIGTLHRSKPDRDNIDKAILDTLFPKCDAAIAAGTIKKIWSDRDYLTITIRREALGPRP